MKRALVTGGSGGIGAAICMRLAADGHHVIVHANRSQNKAQAVVDQITTVVAAPKPLPSMSPSARQRRPSSTSCSKQGRSRFWSITPVFTPMLFFPA
jgi:NAD(P)-dependent dehydrogenase (short-subunit alcohol dehydrogenase family)